MLRMLTALAVSLGLGVSARAQALDGGAYASVPYAQALTSTHSPLAAIAATRAARVPQVVFFAKCASDVPDCLQFVQDFAEGTATCPFGPGLALPGAGRNLPPKERAFCDGPVRGIAIVDPHHFLLPLPSAANATRFRWVLNADRFAALQTVAGTWKDKQGRTWSFSPEDGATVPGVGKDMLFKVQQDTTGRTIDEIDFDTTSPGVEHVPGVAIAPDNLSAALGFVRQGDTLTLFPMVFPPGKEIPTPDRAHPVAVLTLIEKAPDPLPAATIP